MYKICYMSFTLVKTQLCYKQITRKYRLVQDFIFIILYEVSRSILLRCTRTDEFVNKFSNLSALVAQTSLGSCWDSAWFTITSINSPRAILLWSWARHLSSQCLPSPRSTNGYLRWISTPSSESVTLFLVIHIALHKLGYALVCYVAIN